MGYAGQSTEARSDIFFLEIRPFDNEFEEAWSPSGMGREVEDVGNLAAVQKEIIVATWRLARRRNRRPLRRHPILMGRHSRSATPRRAPPSGSWAAGESSRPPTPGWRQKTRRWRVPSRR